MFVTNSGTLGCCGSAPNACRCGGHAKAIENANQSTLVQNEMDWANFYAKTEEERAAEAVVLNSRPLVTNAADSWDPNDDSKPAGGSLAAATPGYSWDPSVTPR